MPIAAAQAKLRNAAEIETGSLATVLLQGLFVMCVAAFETMVNDTLACYYLIFCSFSGIRLASPKRSGLTATPLLQVNKALHSLGYEKTGTILQRFADTLSIDSFEDSVVDSVIEIKETRTSSFTTDSALLSPTSTKRAVSRGPRKSVRS